MKKTGFLCRKDKRLLIRPFKQEDYLAWKYFFDTLASPKNIWDSHIKSKDELSKSSFNKLLKLNNECIKKDLIYRLAVFEVKSGSFIGQVSLMNVVRGVTQSAYLGYLIHNCFWGKGYGKAATLATIDIAFKDLNLHRVEAGIEPYNRKSIFLAKSIGLRKEGLKKKMVLLRGKWQDLTIYSATCEDFSLKWRESSDF